MEELIINDSIWDDTSKIELVATELLENLNYAYYKARGVINKTIIQIVTKGEYVYLEVLNGDDSTYINQLMNCLKKKTTKEVVVFSNTELKKLHNISGFYITLSIFLEWHKSIFKTDADGFYIYSTDNHLMENIRVFHDNLSSSQKSTHFNLSRITVLLRNKGNGQV